MSAERWGILCTQQYTRAEIGHRMSNNSHRKHKRTKITCSVLCMIQCAWFDFLVPFVSVLLRVRNTTSRCSKTQAQARRCTTSTWRVRHNYCTLLIHTFLVLLDTIPGPKLRCGQSVILQISSHMIPTSEFRSATAIVSHPFVRKSATGFPFLRSVS